MPSRPRCLLGQLSTPHGHVSVRARFVPKQHSFILIFEGDQPAILAAMPGWRTRAPASRRAQLTPPVLMPTEEGIVAWWRALEPKIIKHLASERD